MTIQDNGTRNQYTATASQTVFAYTFEIFEEADLTVEQNGSVITAYTVSGVGNDAGGNITLTTPATAGDVITIYRDMELKREQDYQNSGDFLADEVDTDFDRVWAAIQQVFDRSKSAIRPTFDDPILNSSNTELADVATRGGKALGFNDDGTLAYLSSAVPDGTQYYFTTVSAMQSASNLNVGDVVIIGDRYNFKFDVIAPTTNDGFSTIDGTASGVSVQLDTTAGFNIKAFGAIGDSTRAGGGTDDAGAILACVAACVAAGGGKIFCPRGIYRVTSEIDLATGYGAPAIIFEGEGYGPWNQDTPGATSEHTTMFVFDSTTENGFSIHSVSQTLITNLSILDLNIGTRTAGDAIHIKRESWGGFGATGTAAGIFLQGISIKGFYNGVQAERLQTSKISRLFIEDCINDGVQLTSVSGVGSGTSVLFDNVFVKECGRDNYSLNGYSYIGFNVCASDLPGRHGYFIDGAVRDVTAVSFTACGFEDSASPTTGTDDTSSGAAFLTDSGASFTTNQFVGFIIHNTTDGSSGVITANTATTVTATLENGTNNNWDSGDAYIIGGAGFYFGNSVFGVTMNACLSSGATADGVYTRANGLTIIGGKLQVADGYGLNMAAGAGVSTFGLDYSSNTLGKVGGQPTKVIQISPDLSNQILLGHEITTGAGNADIVLRNNSAMRFANAAGTSCANFLIRSTTNDEMFYDVPEDTKNHIFGFAGTGQVQFEEENGGGLMRFLNECSSDPAAPGSNAAKIYLKDNGSGKTQLIVRFATGAVQVLATEP